MNELKFKKGIEEIKKISLSKIEKDVISGNLRVYIGNSIKNKNLPQKSYWVGMTFIMRSAYYTFGVVLVLVAVTGTYSKVSNSLPGDGFYSAKVNVFEPIKYSMAVGEVAKTKVESQNLSNRLIEAEILANQGKLDQSSGEEIESLVKKHVDRISSVINSGTNILDTGLTDARLDFEATVNAHGRILNKIEEKSKDSSKKNNISRIKEVVKKESDRIRGGNFSSIEKNSETMMFSASMNMEAVDVISTSTMEEANDLDFEKEKKETEKLLSQIRKNIEKGRKGKIKVNRQIFEDSSRSFIEAESAMLRAEETKKSGDRKKATEDLRNSKRSAKEAKNSFKASRLIEDLEDD